MGIFEDPEQMKWLAEELGDSISESTGEVIFHNTDDVYVYYPVGSTVLYIPDRKEFIINPPGTNFTNLKDKQVVIGIVLEHLEDNSYIVMYKNFLNTEPYKFSREQLSSTLEAGDNMLGSFISKQFNVLANSMNRRLDKLGIPRMKFMLPSNRHFDIIRYNAEIIIQGLEELTGKLKADNFTEILMDKKIYCNLAGHVITWQMPNEQRQDSYQALNILTRGYFLPIIHLNLNQN